MNTEQIALTRVAQQFAEANREHTKYYRDEIFKLRAIIWAIADSQPNREIKVPLLAESLYRPEDCGFEVRTDDWNRCKVIRAIFDKGQR